MREKSYLPSGCRVLKEFLQDFFSLPLIKRCSIPVFVDNSRRLHLRKRAYIERLGMRHFSVLFLCITMLALSPLNVNAAPLAVDDVEEFEGDVPAVIVTPDAKMDPYEDFNRGVFSFNETIDEMFLEPVARGYRALVPKWGRERIGSAVSNATSPVVFLNNTLQGDVEGMFTTFWRFFINTTFGIGGIFDVASEAGLEKRSEDFGQTLGYHGAESGSYIVLPFFGPSTSRDAVGLVVDTLTNPITYLDPTISISYRATDIVDTRERLLDITDEIEQTSFDPYATIRSAYIQRRAAQIRNEE